MNRSHRFTWAAFVLLSLALTLPLSAEITPSGDFDPTNPAWWENGGDINTIVSVGNTSTGSVVVNGGDILNSERVSIGRESGSTGIAEVSGENSVWNYRYEWYVGYYGNGLLDINNGAKVVSEGPSASCYIGMQAGASGEVHVKDTGSIWDIGTIFRGNLTIGSYGNGSLYIENGGSVINSSGYIGQYANSVGEVNVSGANSTWMNTDNLLIGNGGSGTLNIEDGGSVSNMEAFVGYGEGAIGTITVTGANSAWTNSEDLFVGYRGFGSLNIANGGEVNVSYDTYLGYYSSGGGNIQFNSGTLNTGGLLAGVSELQGVGVINTSGLVSDIDLVFDQNHGLNQQIVLNSEQGQNITINFDAYEAFGDSLGAFGAGYRESGSLRVADGQKLVSRGGYLGYHVGSSGVATVTGDESLWSSGDMYVGHDGSGSLCIGNGGLVVMSEANIGYNSGSIGSVTVSGENSTLEIDSNCYIGRSGFGSMRVENGGSVTDDRSTSLWYIGYLEGSSGSVTIVGNGSTWDTIGHPLYVGNKGNGSLTIVNGGYVFNGKRYVANNPSVTATVTVSGAGSFWDGGDLYVGRSGKGTLNIENGGGVESFYTCIGERSESTAKVTGDGSFWDCHTTMCIGYNDGSDATLSIENGGMVTSDDGQLAWYAGSKGTANIKGAGSKWINDDDLIVGNQGGGVVRVEDGGLLSNTDGTIGHYADSWGNITITGNESHWNNSGDLYVGVDGEGYLRIENKGAVTVGGDLSINSLSTLVFRLKDAGDSLLDVHGNAVLDGSLAVGFESGFTVNYNDVFALIDLTDPAATISGRFINYGEGDTVGTYGGYDLVLSYVGGDGNDVTLTAVPEPGMLSLLVLGAMAVRWRRKA